MLIVRQTLQLASEPLLNIEKFALGGINTVRGYRENQFVRDNGLAALPACQGLLLIDPGKVLEGLFQGLCRGMGFVVEQMV